MSVSRRKQRVEVHYRLFTGTTILPAAEVVLNVLS